MSAAGATRKASAALGAATLLAGGLAQSAAATADPAPVSVSVNLACEAGGGAWLTYTLTNHDEDDAVLADTHFYLEKVTSDGHVFGGAAFLFPSPDTRVIASGASQTWRVPIGLDPEGNSADLSAPALVLGTETWINGYDAVVRRTFGYPGCNG